MQLVGLKHLFSGFGSSVFVALMSISAVASAQGRESRGATFKISKVSTAAGTQINRIEVKGALGPGDAMNWLGAIQSVDPSIDTLVVFNSPGGVFSVGTRIANSIADFEARARANGVKVAVYVTEACASMCIPIYYGFTNRYAKKETKFGFHGMAMMAGMAYDEQLTAIYLKGLNDFAQARSDGELIAWLATDEVKLYFVSTDMTIKTAGELAPRHVGLIREAGLVDSEQTAIARLTEGQNVADLR